MPVAYISERMGHTSEQTTRTYLKSFERSEIDDANKRIMKAILE
jgi:integrase